MSRMIHVDRFKENPIITPDSHPSIGENINGPSLIRVPEWVEKPLGKYYLYFAHHSGDFIRLAYSDRLEGPWRIYEPGTLHLEDSYCVNHIASPDVHVDSEHRRIRMYYHGPAGPSGIDVDHESVRGFQIVGHQRSLVALSEDGLHFTARPEILGSSYFRVFVWKGHHYALGMPGIFYRSRDGLPGFEKGPVLFSEHMRHSAVIVRDGVLHVFYSNAFDCPERILVSRIDLKKDWMQWKESEPITVLEPETDYEGGNLHLEASHRGLARTRVRQLRDPALYEEDGRTYLLYSVAGENGIAIAEIRGIPCHRSVARD